MLRRYIFILFTILSALGILLLKAFNLGKAKQKAKQDKAALDAAKGRQDIEDEINKADATTIKSDLSKWVRKPKK